MELLGSTLSNLGYLAKEYSVYETLCLQSYYY